METTIFLYTVIAVITILFFLLYNYSRKDFQKLKEKNENQLKDLSKELWLESWDFSLLKASITNLILLKNNLEKENKCFEEDEKDSLKMIKTLEEENKDIKNKLELKKDQNSKSLKILDEKLEEIKEIKKELRNRSSVIVKYKRYFYSYIYAKEQFFGKSAWKKVFHSHYLKGKKMPMKTLREKTKMTWKK